jgi:hypothetical protein
MQAEYNKAGVLNVITLHNIVSNIALLRASSINNNE